MNPITSYNYSTADYRSLASAGGSYSTTEFTRVTTSLEQNEDITIITAEGDKVTLSSDSQFQTTYATYEGLVHTKGNSASFHHENIGLEASRAISISVDGNLSKEELKDIDKAVRTIEKIMRDFLSGDIEHAIGRAMKIGKLKSISSLEANLRYERSMCLYQQLVKEVAFVPSELGEEITPRGDTVTADHVDKLTNEMIQVVRNSRIRPANLFKPIKKLFSYLFKELSETDNDFSDCPKLQIAKLIKSHLLERMSHLDENEQDVHEQVMLGSWNEGDDEGIAGNVDDLATKMFS